MLSVIPGFDPGTFQKTRSARKIRIVLKFKLPKQERHQLAPTLTAKHAFLFQTSIFDLGFANAY